MNQEKCRLQKSTLSSASRQKLKDPPPHTHTLLPPIPNLTPVIPHEPPPPPPQPPHLHPLPLHDLILPVKITAELL